MRRLISFMLVCILVFALAGCASGNNAPTDSVGVTTNDPTILPEESDGTEAEDSTVSADSKTLVVYFSRAGEQYGVGVIEKGNTAIVAEMIADETGADVFEILPKEDNYPTTYTELTDFAKEEQNNSARPEIASAVEYFDSYDTIYFGYPIWWGDLPMICYTFLESYDFSGKTVIPFCTHAGSGNAGTQSKILSVIPNTDVREVLAIPGTDAQNDQDSVRQQVAEWLK